MNTAYLVRNVQDLPDVPPEVNTSNKITASMNWLAAAKYASAALRNKALGFIVENFKVGGGLTDQALSNIARMDPVVALNLLKSSVNRGTSPDVAAHAAAKHFKADQIVEFHDFLADKGMPPITTGSAHILFDKLPMRHAIDIINRGASYNGGLEDQLIKAIKDAARRGQGDKVSELVNKVTVSVNEHGMESLVAERGTPEVVDQRLAAAASHAVASGDKPTMKTVQGEGGGATKSALTEELTTKSPKMQECINKVTGHPQFNANSGFIAAARTGATRLMRNLIDRVSNPVVQRALGIALNKGHTQASLVVAAKLSTEQVTNAVSGAKLTAKSGKAISAVGSNLAKALTGQAQPAKVLENTQQLSR